MEFLRRALDIWRQWRYEEVSLKKVLFGVTLTAAIFFLLGRQYPESDYRKLRAQLEQRQNELRTFAAGDARRDREIIKMRTAAKLNAKTIAALESKIGEMSADNLKHWEKVVFFREALGEKPANQEMAIYALDETPDFRPQRRRLSAALVRTSKSKPFNGAYYFEVVQNIDGTKKIVRVPPKPAALKFKLYREIEEIMELSELAEIENIRLVVLNKKGAIIAQEVLLTAEEKKRPLTPVVPLRL